MRILIIGSRFAPIPCVCGGAIEALIDEYLKFNSVTKKVDITVYSAITSEISEEIINKYANVDFRFINKNKIYYKILHLICGIIRKIFKNRFGDEFVRLIKKDMKERKDLDSYDKIIILNNINNIIYICSQIQGKHILYLHNDYLNIDTPNGNKILNVLDQVWCVSKYIKRRVDMIYTNNKTRVLYNGTDLNKFIGNVDMQKILDLRNRYQINADDFVVLYTGRIMEAKGVKELIVAFKKFSLNKENVKLVVVGGPTDFSVNYYYKLLEMCSDSQKNIHFLGNKSHDDFKVLYKIAKVQVVPSIWNEAFGLTVVEGMSAGLPMIVSNSGGIPELVDNKCAIIVDKNNIVNELVESLDKLYYDKKLCQDIAKNARIKVKEYSKEVFLNNIENMILEKL